LVESYKPFRRLGKRTDIPFVVMLSFLYGERRSAMQFWLPLGTILMVIFLIIDARFINEEPIGFVFAFAAVLLDSTNSFFRQYPFRGIRIQAGWSTRILKDD